MHEMLQCMGFPSTILPSSGAAAKSALSAAFELARAKHSPVFLVVRKNTFRDSPVVLRKKMEGPFAGAPRTWSAFRDFT